MKSLGDWVILGERRVIVLAETGGIWLRVPAIWFARAIMSWVRMIRSSSLLGVLLVSALALAPVGLAFAVLVLGWALELGGVGRGTGGGWDMKIGRVYGIQG